MTHTPGPWELQSKQKRNRKYYEHGESITVLGRGRCCFGVATVAGPSNFDKQNEMRANARLIAASPMLLEALIVLESFISCGISTETMQKGDAIQQARAAIAQAEGRGK